MKMNAPMPAVALALALMSGCASQTPLRHAYDPARAQGQEAARIDTRPGLFITAVDDYVSCNLPVFCKLPQSVMVLPGEHTLYLRYADGSRVAQGELALKAAAGGQYRVGYEIKDQRYIRFLVEEAEAATAAAR